MPKDQYSPIRPFNLNNHLETPSPIHPTNLANLFGSHTPQNTHPNGGSVTIGNNNAPFIPFPQMPGLPATPSNLISMPTGSVLDTPSSHGPSMSIARGAPLQAVAAPFTIGSLDYSPSSSIHTSSSPFARLSVAVNLDEDFKLADDEISDTDSTSGDELSDEEYYFLQEVDFVAPTPQANTKRARDPENSEDSDEHVAKEQKVDETPEHAAETLHLGDFTHLISPIALSGEEIPGNVFDDLELATSDEDDNSVITPTVLNTAFIEEDDTSGDDDSLILFSDKELAAELAGDDLIEISNP